MSEGKVKREKLNPINFNFCHKSVTHTARLIISSFIAGAIFNKIKKTYTIIKFYVNDPFSFLYLRKMVILYFIAREK